MFRLDDKVAIVIGGAGGLGEAVVKAYSEQGAKVAVADVNIDMAKKVADSVNGKAYAVDVTKEESVKELADSVIKEFGTIDILVNAHGINRKMLALEMDFGAWDTVFAVNVRGVMIPCKVIGEKMIERKQGRIINFSSVRGIRGTDGGNVLYGATKGAVDMITRMLAAEWAQYGINVNAVGPSVALTENFKKAVAPERLELLKSKTLFKRFLDPEDVGVACVYLASDEAKNITGLIHYVDGGLTAIG
ncbi:MAG: SDR family oxidoreductase [Spirochaetes bacterium]|nr:SDR family oxidoreductase [Spirochaetota bacterium]